MRPSRLAAAIGMVVATAPAIGAQSAGVAFEHVTVVPMDRPGVLGDRTVIVRNGVIAEITPASRPAPAGAVRIDGRGKYLFPGLTDTHVHLEGNAGAWLGLFLAHGVTTVFNLRGGPEQLELRRRVAVGELAGPTIYTSGPFTNQPTIMTADDARRTVKEQKAAGYDFAKIHGNLTEDAYAALIHTGREEALTIIGHAPRNLSFDSVISARQPLVVHAEELIYTKFRALDTLAIPELAARTAQAGVWLTPTLTTFAGIVAQWGRPPAADSALGEGEGKTLPPSLKQYWTGSNPYVRRTTNADFVTRALAFQRPMVGMLYRAGVPLLAGTDTPLPVMLPGHSLHQEFVELERSGVDRWGALAAATANPGRFIATFVDHGSRFGTITPGSRADLLLVDGNPLDDPTVLVHPTGVMARGRWFDRPALDRMVEVAARAPALAKVVAGLTLTEAERQPFVGVFTAEGGGLSVKVFERDGALRLEVPGQPLLELVPTAPGRFAATGSIWTIELEFDQGRTGLVVNANGSRYAVLRRAP
jgi:imidazolonepropionase-like amidohydrolase